MSKNGYDFYLGLCLLPITPDKLTVKINNANSTLTLIDEGQINILKKAELTDVEFECRIPQTKYPFAKYKTGFLGASFFLSYFENSVCFWNDKSCLHKNNAHISVSVILAI